MNRWRRVDGTMNVDMVSVSVELVPPMTRYVCVPGLVFYTHGSPG